MLTECIVAASVVLGLFFISAMALVMRFFVHKHNKPTTSTEDMYTTDGCIERQHQLAHVSTSWKRLFAPKQSRSRGQWVPTLSGVIEAGDEGFVSSTLFDSLHERPGDVPLEALYEAFAGALRSRPMAERSTYSGELSKFLAGTKRASGELGRAKSVSHKATQLRADGPSRTRKSLDFSAAERGLARSISIKRPAPVLVPMTNVLVGEGKQRAAQGSWMKHGQNAESRDGRMSVRITSAELAALSVLLGSPVNVGAESGHAPLKQSAFGISISSFLADDGKHQVTLRQHKRTISQQHARGSGFSPLYAKHLAASSLPYSQDKNHVHSIIVNNETFEAIQAGAILQVTPSTTRTPQSDFITSLPSSRKLSFHILAASLEEQSRATLLDVVSALPFTGGLPPLASVPLIKTVQFIASGGLPPARLLQRLEGLIDKVHSQVPHLALFGPLYEPQNVGLLYRERGRLGKLATNPKTADSPADKAARVSRYITLLERLMALVPDLKPQDVLAAVQEATTREFQRAYADAVSAHNNPCAPLAYNIVSRPPFPNARTKRHSTASRASPRRSDCSSLGSVFTSPASSDTFPVQNLGRLMEDVLKSELPLSVETVAFVARMVIVAWTLSVETVAWEDDEMGFRVLDGIGLGEKLVLC